MTTNSKYEERVNKVAKDIVFLLEDQESPLSVSALSLALFAHLEEVRSSSDEDEPVQIRELRELCSDVCGCLCSVGSQKESASGMEVKRDGNHPH